MDTAPAAPVPHGHAHGHHHHEHHHHHAHEHGAERPAPTSARFSLIALSAPARLMLALPPIAGLWLLAAWALQNG